MIDTNYILWIIGAIWWAIMILIEHYGEPEKSEPAA